MCVDGKEKKKQVNVYLLVLLAPPPPPVSYSRALLLLVFGEPPNEPVLPTKEALSGAGDPMLFCAANRLLRSTNTCCLSCCSFS